MSVSLDLSLDQVQNKSDEAMTKAAAKVLIDQYEAKFLRKHPRIEGKKVLDEGAIREITLRAFEKSGKYSRLGIPVIVEIGNILRAKTPPEQRAHKMYRNIENPASSPRPTSSPPPSPSI